MPHERHSRRAKSGVLSASDMFRDIKAMNSSILILSQKMKYLVRNEKILGQNLIVLNKKLRALEQRGIGSVVSHTSGEGVSTVEVNSLRDELAVLEEKINSISAEIKELKEKMDSISASHVSSEELKELKYLVENIDPLEIATLDQVKELIKKASRKRK